MKKRHSEEQIIRILRKAESRELPIREVCRQRNFADVMDYASLDLGPELTPLAG